MCDGPCDKHGPRHLGLAHLCKRDEAQDLGEVQAREPLAVLRDDLGSLDRLPDLRT